MRSSFHVCPDMYVELSFHQLQHALHTWHTFPCHRLSMPSGLQGRVVPTLVTLQWLTQIAHTKELKMMEEVSVTSLLPHE